MHVRVRHLALALALVGAVAVHGTAQAQSTPSNPLENAKAGQWVVQKATASGMTSYVYQWVAKVEGKKITLRMQPLTDDGKTGMVPAMETVVDLSAAGPGASQAGSTPAAGPAAKMSADHVELNGKKLACTKFEVASGPVTSTTWLCADVPVTGMVRSVSVQDGNEVARCETVDFGHEGGADRPVGGAAGGGAPHAVAAGGGASVGAAPEAKTAAPAAPAGFHVGDVVAAQWKDGNWYQAEVIALRGEKFAVEYADGDSGLVPESQLRHMARSGEVQVGDAVVAVWKQARMYGGVVHEVKGDGVVVRWDDGDKPSHVAFGQLFKK